MKAGSRLLLGCWFVAADAAAAQPVTPDEAIAAQQNQLREALRLRCPEMREDEEIVVCGRQTETGRYRVPPSAGSAAATGGRAGGEQMAALEMGSVRCDTTSGGFQQCGHFDILGLGMMVVKRAVTAVRNRD